MSAELERLRAMKLLGMLLAFEEQLSEPQFQELSFEQRFGLIVDREWTKRQNRRYARLLHEAKFRLTAAPEEIDFHVPRGLERGVLQALFTADWVRRHQNVLLTGPTGVGKTFVACALGHAACREGFKVRYYRTSRLLAALSLAKGDGSYPKLMNLLETVPLLILDDWGLDSLNDSQGRDLLDVVDGRIGRGATLLASQLPVEKWHGVLHDPTLADAILDRLVHSAHKLAMKGESMRKTTANLDLR